MSSVGVINNPQTLCIAPPPSHIRNATNLGPTKRYINLSSPEVRPTGRGAWYVNYWRALVLCHLPLTTPTIYVAADTLARGVKMMPTSSKENASVDYKKKHTPRGATRARRRIHGHFRPDQSGQHLHKKAEKNCVIAHPFKAVISEKNGELILNIYCGGRGEASLLQADIVNRNGQPRITPYQVTTQHQSRGWRVRAGHIVFQYDDVRL